MKNKESQKMPKKTTRKENLSYVMDSSQSEMHLKSNVRRKKIDLGSTEVSTDYDKLSWKSY